MPPESQRAKAQRFLELHRGPRLLLIGNAWDAGSAKVFAAAGVQALGTSSAGIALSFGLPDGERITRERMLERVREITAAVAIPVTADLEAGYGTTPEAAAKTARAAIAAGAVGMNLEDITPKDGRLVDVPKQVKKIQAVGKVAAAGRIAFVLNARVDVFLRQVGTPESRFDETVRRANAYLDAGAACAFIPGVSDGYTIGRLVRAVHGPVNILAVPGTPPIAELERLGVRRVSVGSGPMRATLALTQRIAREMLERGTYAGFTEHTPPLGDFNRMFER